MLLHQAASCLIRYQLWQLDDHTIRFLSTTGMKPTRVDPGAFLKYLQEMESIVETSIAIDGGDRHPDSAQKQLHLTNVLALTPA